MSNLNVRYNYGVCVATTSVIRCEIGQIPVSKTLVRTFAYEPWFDGRCYSVFCPELGPYESAHLTKQEFVDQFAVTAEFFGGEPLRLWKWHPQERRDKHFRLSTHRGGKHRAVHEPAYDPDEEGAEEYED